MADESQTPTPGRPGDTSFALMGATAKQLLAAWKGGDHYLGHYLTYDDLVKTIADEIVSCATFGSYQGDFVFHLRKDGVQGILIAAYGSCSGCDALEAALAWTKLNSDEEAFVQNGLPDVMALRDQLAASVKWASDGPLFERHGGEYEWWNYGEEGMKEYVLELAKAIDTDQPPPHPPSQD